MCIIIIVLNIMRLVTFVFEKSYKLLKSDLLKIMFCTRYNSKCSTFIKIESLQLIVYLKNNVVALVWISFAYVCLLLFTYTSYFLHFFFIYLPNPLQSTLSLFD